MTTAETYEAINALWPKPCPAISRTEAERAGRKLYEHFHRRRRFSKGKPYRARQVWISAKPYDGLSRGWRRLVHDMSHRVFDYQNAKTRTSHGGWHAELELEMARYVLAQGWLDGRLKTAEAPKPSLDEKREAKLKHAERMLARWEKRAKTAAGRIKTWRARARRYERAWVRGKEVA